MLRIGDSVVITPANNSKLLQLFGRTGVVMRIFRNPEGDIIYGVKVDEVPNPKSKYDTFWFSESEVCKLYPSCGMPKSTRSLFVNSMQINKVIYNPPATIVLWADGSKTVVKCSKNEDYDAEKGLAMALCKKMFGNDNSYHKIFKEHAPEPEPEPEKEYNCWNAIAEIERMARREE